MIQGECEKCEERGDYHGPNCIVRALIFNNDKARMDHVDAIPALEAAILALETFLKRDNTLTMSCKIIPFEKSRGRKMNTSLNTDKALQVKNDINEVMEKVLIVGDLSKMEPKDRINYYLRTCESMGMNPMTKPFDLITLNGKMILYPNRSGGDQLRKIGSVDTQIVSKGFDKDTGCYVVVARAKLPNGRTDEDMGIVYCAGMKGESLANAQLKAMTKAKRRVTLSIMGLGWIDESEVSSVKNAKTHKMDLETGAIIDDQVLDPALQGNLAPKVVIPPKGKALPPHVGPSSAQLARLFALAREKGITTKDELKYWIANTFNFNPDFTLTALTAQEYEDICSQVSKISVSKPGDFDEPEFIPFETDEKQSVLPSESQVHSTVTVNKPSPNAVKENDLPWTKHLPK